MFLKEYNRVLGLMISYIWDNGISWEVVNKKTGEITHKTCCPSQGYFDTPKYFDYKIIKVQTDLSARALSSMTSQAMGMISATVKKQSKRIYLLEKLKEDPINNKRDIIRLTKKIKKNPPQKPKVENQSVELSSKCATLIEQKDGEFNYFLQIQSIGKIYGKILIPIRLHKHSNKLKTQGRLMGSFLVNINYVDFRWEVQLPEKKKEGLVVGGDTGKNTLLTLSNETTTDQVINIHGHTLTSIIEKLSRKKKGSKGFEKAQKLRTNFINWSIKQLSLNGVKELRLEKVKNVFYKNSYSRKMSHWVNSEIEKAIEKSCELNGVHLVYQDSSYRSQRCNHCGLVRKANRKGKVYKCHSCGTVLDSDLNSSKNHEIDLPPIPSAFRHLKLNRKGFYWNPNGFFNLNGSVLRVPDTSQENSPS